MPKEKHQYLLREGMRLEKNYYGKLHSLLIVRHHGKIMFKVDDKIFGSLTSAAKHVCRNETISISGPNFWGAVKVSPKTRRKRDSV